MKPIKVCHIVNLITGQADGVYTHLKSIFRNYDKTKYEHFLIFQGGEKVEREVQALGVKVFISPSLNKKLSLRTFVDLYHFVKTNEIDILHAHMIKPYTITGLVNIFLRRKFIFNYHGLFLKSNIYYSATQKIIYRLNHMIISLIRKVNIVLVPSERSKNLLISETRFFPEPIVYYNGIHIDKKHNESNPLVKSKLQEIRDNSFIIALIGRLEIDKRIDRAILIIKELVKKQKKIHLIVFGDGSLRNKLQEIVDEFELKKNVTLFGYVEEMKNYYQFFDIVLFTSDWEGMPLTMWEAMVNEVPLIAPDVGGFKEILEKNNCGLIYEPGNIMDAELKLIQLLDDVQLRKSLGNNGRVAVETKYSEEKFIQQIEKVYEDLVNK